METIEAAFEHDSALVFGVGGGGDVVGAVPTARLLEDRGLDVLLGGIAYERAEIDPTVGPRGLEELEAAERVNDVLALATGATRSADGVAFAESRVAGETGERVALLDVNGGPGAVAAGLDDACERLGIDLVVGVDAGGDALAAGDEPGLRSPLTDAVMLAALSELETAAALGVIGYGSDGELTPEELDAAVSRVAGRDGLLGAWGITPRVRGELEALVEAVPTEASRLPVAAARGEFGETAIRGGEHVPATSPASAVTFYFDPATVAAGSEPAGLVRGTGSFRAADAALREAGYRTEISYEERREGE